MPRWVVGLGAMMVGCVDGGPKSVEAPDDVPVDIIEPFDGQIVQYTTLEVVGEAVFPDVPDASSTWSQWTSEPASAVAASVCTETMDGVVLRTACVLDTTEPVSWLTLEVGTDGPEGLISGGTTLLVVWRDNVVPTVQVVEPVDGAVVETTLLVGLEIFDDDPAAALDVVWRSDVQGALEAVDATVTEQGTYAAILELDPGAHRLTVSVADQWGVTAEAEVAVVVE